MEALEGWREFNVAMIGATAALAGLVIVAASVNIADIVKTVSLTARLAAGITGLVLALTGSAIALVPGMTGPRYGWAMVVAALIAAVFPAQAARRVLENRDPANRMRPVKAIVGFIAPVAYLVGGALLIAGTDAGLVWFAFGSVLAIIAALLISWVVLVEVLR